MTRRTKWLALIAGAIIVLGAGRMVLRYLDWQASEAARTDVAHLQTIATSACRCTRQKGDAGSKACWQEYKAAIAGLDVSEMATMCAPVSLSLDCIATDAGEQCIVTDYIMGICTAEEAQAAEGAYNAALNAEGDFSTLDQAAAARANGRANAAFEDVLQRIRRGERVVSSAASGGCVG